MVSWFIREPLPTSVWRPRSRSSRSPSRYHGDMRTTCATRTARRYPGAAGRSTLASPKLAESEALAKRRPVIGASECRHSRRRSAPVCGSWVAAATCLSIGRALTPRCRRDDEGIWGWRSGSLGLRIPDRGLELGESLPIWSGLPLSSSWGGARCGLIMMCAPAEYRPISCKPATHRSLALRGARPEGPVIGSSCSQT